MNMDKKGVFMSNDNWNLRNQSDTLMFNHQSSEPNMPQVNTLLHIIDWQVCQENPSLLI